MNYARRAWQLTATGLLCILGIAWGQSVQDTAPQTGFLPSNTYAIDKLETIDRVNGNVMYHIPLAPGCSSVHRVTKRIPL